MTTLYLRNSISRLPLRPGLLLVPLALAWFALWPCPQAFGVTPAPDGGYSGFNTAEGQNALQSLTSGQDNTAIGFQALYHNNGSYNTAEGFRALFSNTSGTQNTANGVNALISNTTGNYNTANGVNTLYHNTTGTYNTANGDQALYTNTIGNFNVANGYQALYSNTTGFYNTATGNGALLNNTTGTFNTATGFAALARNTGTGNTAYGSQALYSNTTGEGNVANGYQALISNTTGGGNTANGDSALYSNTTGIMNTAVGNSAGDSITGNGNVDIGAFVFGVAGENNTTRIKNVYETVQPVVGTDPDYVSISSGGRLGRADVSSRRYKHDIKPMDKASEAILALKPVTFRYKQEFDATQTLAYGLIAEEVAEVYPDLVGRNREGQPESVRYEQINAMLLNEFLKEHRKMQRLETIIAKQQKQIEALTTGLQKVSAQLELSNSAPQMAVNNQ
jgi:hypothetical protein